MPVALPRLYRALRTVRAGAAWLAVSTFAVALPAGATQTVYRCGPAGNLYSQQPCPDGRPVDVDDSRTPEQVAQARAAVREQQQLGQALARERRAEEAARRPAGASGIRVNAGWPEPVRSAHPAQASPRRGKGAKKPPASAPPPDSFMAVAPSTGKPARRGPQPLP
jgi:hypothetical protein